MVWLKTLVGDWPKVSISGVFARPPAPGRRLTDGVAARRVSRSHHPRQNAELRKLEKRWLRQIWRSARLPNAGNSGQRLMFALSAASPSIPPPSSIAIHHHPSSSIIHRHPPSTTPVNAPPSPIIAHRHPSPPIIIHHHPSSPTINHHRKYHTDVHHHSEAPIITHHHSLIAHRHWPN